MTYQPILLGAAPNDGTGDPLRTAYDKINDNFTELYAEVVGVLDLAGDQDCSANPNYPAAVKGDAYYVTVAGKIGGASGKTVAVGDMFIAKADNAGGAEGSVGTSWFVLEKNLDGALVAANNLSDVASPITARASLDVDGALCHPGHIAGRWYSAHPYATLANGVALNSARSYWAPFYLPEAITITDLAARVITASAAGLFGLAIYANNPATNYPMGAALASLTGLSTTAGNTPVSGTLGAPVAFSRGWHWGAHMVDNGTATFTILQVLQAGFPGLIGDATLGNVAPAAASQITGLQNTAINYASGFTNATTAIGSFSVVSASHAALYYKD